MTVTVRKERPLGVTIIGVLLLLVGLLSLLAGLAINSIEDLEGLELAVEIVSLVIGLIYIILALGFFKGWGWVWLLTMIVVILGIIWSIASWVVGGLKTDAIWGLLIGLIIPIIIVLYMNSNNVKMFFKKY
ncbi:MAG: hypothetical protein MIO90_06200 [Methanomassiliicoccales archaeon]|nr:hypothetical protein [Methanomassiliicoccales archaeon]